MMSDFLRLLISLSLSGGALTLLGALLNRMLKGKMPQTFLYYLWLPVLIRFLIPVGMDWSLTNRLVSPDSKVQGEVQEEMQAAPVVNIPQAAPVEPSAESFAASKPQTSIQPQIPDRVLPDKIISWRPSLSLILMGIWGIGVLVCILWRIRDYKRLSRELWQGLRPIKQWEKNLLQAHTTEMHTCPVLLRSAAAQSPMLMGLVDPTIWLPEEIMDASDLSYALRHELTHWKRRDLWLKWATVLTACIYWFNPAVWYLVYAINRDCELSCDELVVKGLSINERSGYGELLLRSAVGDSSVGTFFVPFGNQKKMMKERLQIIVRKNINMRKACVLLAAAVTVVILAGIALGAYAFVKEPDSIDPQGFPTEDQAQNNSDGQGDANIEGGSLNLSELIPRSSAANKLSEARANISEARANISQLAGGNLMDGVKDGQSNSGEGKDGIEAVLTSAVIARLAAKHGELSIEDFAPYLDLTPLKEQGSLWETVEFTYMGETMYLRISASDKSIAAAPYEGELDGAVVFHKEFLELETMEQEYVYMGSCADIRSGNLSHILNRSAVKMEDYLTVSLPQDLVQSDFKYWMGSHGGVAFYRVGQIQSFTIENAGIYAEKPLPGGIEIWGAGELGQGMEVVKEFDSLVLGDVVLRRQVLQTDQGTRWYAAYTERPGSSMSYCFYLREDEFTEEEFLEASSTIQLMEYAIY